MKVLKRPSVPLEAAPISELSPACIALVDIVGKSGRMEVAGFSPKQVWGLKPVTFRLPGGLL